MFPAEGIVLAAVSGGADSMCLLALLKEVAEVRGFTVAAVHFNHRLRGEESDRDAAFVDNICSGQNIACYVGEGDVARFAAENGIGVEAAAREMRYSFFYETAEKTGAVKIATAHTADDNAETMLLNLVRGTGLTGLCGIPPVRGNIIRPLLETSREEVERFLEERGIPHVEDSTNSQDIYTRNKLRHSVIPVLKQINPRLTDAVSSAARLLREDDEYLDGLADNFIKEHCSGGRVPVRELEQMATAIAGRVIKKMADGLSSKHVAAILELCISDSPSAGVSAPSISVYREYNDIVFDSDLNESGFAPVTISLDETVDLPEANLRISCCEALYDDKIYKSFTTFLFKSDEVCGKIILRPRMPGDKLALAGRNVTKTLKKLFIENRIPARKRSLVPVIADDLGVLAIFGIGRGMRALPSLGDTVIKMTFEEIPVL